MKNAINICKQLQQQGFEAVFAGGCVRDLLLGKTPNDFDIATNALPYEVEAIFGSNKVIHCGKAFLVARVNLDGEQFEVATFRSESSYSDGRHPDQVKPTNMKEDSNRRDFTINAIFYDPLADKYYDFHDGIGDLENKIVRFVGEAQERIDEDALRILRAFRFAARFNFDMTDHDIKVLTNNFQVLSRLSADRITEELTKGLLQGGELFFRLLGASGAWKIIIPEIDKLIGCTQSPVHHPEGDVFEHTALMLGAAKNLDPVLAWGIVFHDIGKPDTWKIDSKGKITNHGHAYVGARITEKILRTFRFSNSDICDIVTLVENHMKFIEVQNMRQSKVLAMLQRKTFEKELELHRVDCLCSNKDFSNYNFMLEKFQSTPKEIVNPVWLVNGKDLLDLGFEAGPALGKALSEIHDLQLNGDLTTKEQCLEYAKKMIE